MENRNTIKYFIWISLLILSDCSTSKLADFKVTPNDVADIELILKKNKSFVIYFKVFEDMPPEKYTFTGNWNEKADMIRLNFKLNKQDLPDLYALFDPALDETKSIRILDKKTVEFKKSLRKINIWGLSCEKKTR